MPKEELLPPETPRERARQKPANAESAPQPNPRPTRPGDDFLHPPVSKHQRRISLSLGLLAMLIILIALVLMTTVIGILFAIPLLIVGFALLAIAMIKGLLGLVLRPLVWLMQRSR